MTGTRARLSPLAPCVLSSNLLAQLLCLIVEIDLLLERKFHFRRPAGLAEHVQIEIVLLHDGSGLEHKVGAWIRLAVARPEERHAGGAGRRKLVIVDRVPSRWISHFAL